MAIVTLRYWAAAKEAAGIAEETVSAATLAEALAAARGQGGQAGRGAEAGQAAQAGAQPGPGDARRDGRLRGVLARSSFLIDGTPVGSRAPESVVLGDAAVIEVLPPFAGG
jgi:sulfur-carrier protein